MPVPNYSWKQIGIDLVGPLACTEEGNKYIIVVTDYFTKWPEARAAPTKEAFHVANFLPETYDDMIQCENCEQWYYMNCVGLSAPPKDSENWYCSLCRV